jgi:hypothetical protein
LEETRWEGQNFSEVVAPQEEEEEKSYGTTVVYAVRRWPKRRFAAHTFI